ncbi:MAG: hypothetical protein PHC88_10205 [Terrimicrobiaceae bacterium]|nr:hypothetical protein [Terrimicrobiaceae bacterium]
MREETDKRKLEQFMLELGRRVRSGGAIFLTGGGTAVWEGWRSMTIDIDLKGIPEPVGFFEALAEIKELLSVNIELASPDDFIPELSGWRDRSVFIARHGRLDFFHYDPYSQALAKIERSHKRDLADVASMFERGLIRKNQLKSLFQSIEKNLIRFPSINAREFRHDVFTICGDEDES